MAESKKPSLRQYHAKRNFTSTPEPKGDIKKAAKRSSREKGLFFCVQKHLASHLHYDLRLEYKGVLLSWAVPKGPSLNPKDKRLAMRVEDHPLDYGEFEGVIPEGYGAGVVMLWDKGTWEPESPDIDAALERGDLKFHLKGVKLKGSWVLVRTRGFTSRRSTSERSAPETESRSWLLIKHKDEWAGDVDLSKRFDKSVKSNSDFADILAEENPTVWESHRPAQGGAAGKMLADIIQKAAAIKAKKKPAKPKRGRKS